MSYLNSLKQTFDQLYQTNSFAVGLTVALPTWIMKQHGLLPNSYHDVLVIALLIVIVLDWLCGSVLARRSQLMVKSSSTAIDSLIRDFMIMLCVALSYLMDYELQTGSLIFVAFTMAFIWQNFVSVMANIYVLGWEKYFPLWLIKIIDQEIKHKIKKYIKGE